MTEDERPRWQRWLINRFVLVPAGMAVAILLWNLYVVTHDTGIVRGRVVGPDGAPVAGATVTLWTLHFTTFAEKDRATTDAQGRFEFTNNQSHNIQLSADKAGIGHARRLPVRLYFKAQEVTLREPLRLAPGA